VDSSPKCNNASSRADMSCLVESHGKDGKQRTFPTFPRHGYGDLYDSIPDIRCTWTLYVPTPPGVSSLFVRFSMNNLNKINN
jgi:hypothetical protein